MKIGAARRLSRFAAFCLCVISACERKAPSPEECLEFAMRGLRINDQRLLAVPAFKDKVDALVVKCLTTPYDKELIRCIKARAAVQSCMLEFDARELRRGHPADRQ